MFSNSSWGKPPSCADGVVTAFCWLFPAIFWAHAMQSMACSRNQLFASGTTLGRLLKKYLFKRLSIASLWSAPKSISAWHVTNIVAVQRNPSAFFHFASWDVKPPWQMIFQSSTSSNPAKASSRKITSVYLSIMALLKFFCFVTRAIRFNGTIWKTGENRLVLPLSAEPIAHATGCLCGLGGNKARKSVQNLLMSSSERLFRRISSKYLGSGSLVWS